MATTPDKIFADGYGDFSGGMDSSRGAGVIGKNQFVWSTNCQLNKNRTGIACRPGYRPVTMIFFSEEEERIYKEGDFQGDGYFFNGTEAIILLTISGYVFQLREVGRYRYDVKILNPGSQNNPDNINSYITPVKNSAVVNDGESAPIKITIDNSSRVTGKYAIKVGHSGVYVQNRFYYIDYSRENIIASTIKDPYSIEEAYLSNIYGFTAPEDNDYITAIGKVTTLREDVSGGNLAFSTYNNNYTVDVRGARTSWGSLAQQGVGHVANSIPDIGAISPFSYESLNSNLYFRNIGLGLVSLKRAQSEFQNLNGYTSQSVEANNFFDNDSEIFLSQCRSKSYKSKLYTTINPFQKNNTVLWKGLIVFSPAFYSSSQEGVLPSFYESIYTGLDMHSILSIKYPDDNEDLFISAVDKDGFNILYVLDDSIDYDIDKNNKKIEIERKILTRAFDFSNPYLLKLGNSQSYSLSEMGRDTKVEIFSRPSDSGKFYKQSSLTHKVGNIIPTSGKFCPKAVKKQERQNVSVASDPSAVDGTATTGNKYYLRQDLIKILGPANLKRWIRTATLTTPEKALPPEEIKGTPNIYDEERIFTHKL